MQMRQRDVAAPMQNTRILADGAGNDALRDDAAAGRRRLHDRASVCQSCVKPPPPPADNVVPSPDWQTPLNGDYFLPSERG